MVSFTEKTLAEQNFGVCWWQQIAPLIARYTERRRRRMMFASLITGIAVGFGVVVALLQAQIASLFTWEANNAFGEVISAGSSD